MKKLITNYFKYMVSIAMVYIIYSFIFENGFSSITAKELFLIISTPLAIVLIEKST